MAEVPAPGDGGASQFRGACFGFAVDSPVRWRMLRPGTGTPLAVTLHSALTAPATEPMISWFERDVAVARLFGTGDTGAADGGGDTDGAGGGPMLLDVAGLGCYRIDPHRPAISIPEEAVDRIELRLWGIPVALCRIAAGDHVLHAATVEVDGRAVAFAAPGRFGKTTLACAFLAAGHRLLTEDLTGCRTSPVPQVWPGAAGVRVRRDVYGRLELPGTTVAREDAGTVQVSIDEDRRGDASPVPLAAIVLLRKSEGEATLTRVPSGRAVQDLWAVSLRLPTDEDRSRCFGQVGDLAARVPVWNLTRRLAFDDLRATVDLVIAECLP